LKDIKNYPKQAVKPPALAVGSMSIILLLYFDTILVRKNKGRK